MGNKNLKRFNEYTDVVDPRNLSQFDGNNLDLNYLNYEYGGMDNMNGNNNVETSETSFIAAQNASNSTNSTSSSSILITNQYQPIKSIINYHTTNTNEITSNSINRNRLNTNSNGPGSCSSNVKFSGLIFKEKIDEREKYLTAKYPNHQMALIKKRLKVEFWIDEQLKILYNIGEDETKEDHDICADDLVDSLLDMDTDKEREYHIMKQLTKAKKSKEDVMNFVNELLVKLRML